MSRWRGVYKKIMRFSNAHKRWPIVTCVFIGICVAVFSLQQTMLHQFGESNAFVPENAVSNNIGKSTANFVFRGY